MFSFIIKIIIFITFGIFYIVNNNQLALLAGKIQHELIAPYSHKYDVVYVTPTKSSDLPTPAISIITTAPEIISSEQRYPTPIIITATPVASKVNEDDLWRAITTYRKAHGKNDINKSESLCIYARKRANDLFKRLSTNPESPLDNHDGFIKDAESGDIFKQTGFTYVGENLAYLPTTTNATQVIEWGWDSSPKHRSLQLSSDITSGCIAVAHPIYVAIYSY